MSWIRRLVKRFGQIGPAVASVALGLHSAFATTYTVTTNVQYTLIGVTPELTGDDTVRLRVSFDPITLTTGDSIYFTDYFPTPLVVYTKLPGYSGVYLLLGGGNLFFSGDFQQCSGPPNCAINGDFYFGNVIPYNTSLITSPGTPSMLTGVTAELTLIDGSPITIDGFQMSALSTPEPSTWAMMLLGFAGLGFVGYRRNRSSIAPGRRA